MKLTEFPEWFQNLDEAAEILGHVCRDGEVPSEDDLKKVFESVIVIAITEEKEEDKSEHDAPKEVMVPVPESTFEGFDTSDELFARIEELDEGDWPYTVHFVYNTRKKLYYEIETDYKLKGVNAEGEALPFDVTKGKPSRKPVKEK